MNQRLHVPNNLTLKQPPEALDLATFGTFIFQQGYTNFQYNLDSIMFPQPALILIAFNVEIGVLSDWANNGS
jgi:hypothetical protein